MSGDLLDTNNEMENDSDQYNDDIIKACSGPLPIDSFSTPEFANLFIRQCERVRTKLSPLSIRRRDPDGGTTLPGTEISSLHLWRLPRQHDGPPVLLEGPVAPRHAPDPRKLPVPWRLRRPRFILPRGISSMARSMPRSLPICSPRRSCCQTRSSC